MTSEVEQKLYTLGLKPSISEENGLKFMEDTDISIFSPGISTGGFAEIRMALANPDRKIIATTIDQKGLDYANKNIQALGLTQKIITKLQDVTQEFPYGPSTFDFIYARLILHYLSFTELDIVLTQFRKSLKSSGRIYIVVRTIHNPSISFYPSSQLLPNGPEMRYFMDGNTLSSYLARTGFTVISLNEYQEQLYTDFMRTKQAFKKDDILEVLAK